ncbi:hypothetical protein CKN86_11815 [Carnobacterium divergens]|uniref:hypothetical protein n=1 Tax=Carnobacterium divergens TaxID=2748 RepID=UPI000D21C71D|nr:hypothetical protein [Carnobacterium divergens]MCO6017477.1 hypothetical protein [Carnobacterium divergens]TFI61093.1 hypothetical protein CKN62_11955 [Carnobacterium divergens]TFI88115.1 hypothetical protein CKN84_11845 [Carnobacterium divergens]TFJ02683.1 hypothetical protein CKN86_11815 [Carnobacterium divergens]TFJ04193.1 hypothetical protein CKN65_11855 [Carnobacterium divergens]
MSINLKELVSILKKTPYKVYRDYAPTTAVYPYIVYSFIGESEKRASNRIFRSLPLYQISLFTSGKENDLKPIRSILNEYCIPFSPFGSIQGDENDATITNFYTNVRCVENAD